MTSSSGNSLIPVDILAEEAMFTFNRTGGGFEIRTAAYSQVPEISNLVTGVQPEVKLMTTRVNNRWLHILQL